MAFGTTSSVFGAFITDTMNASHALDVDTHTLKLALYGNTGTPDKNVAASLTAYNAATSQWVTANEVTDAGGWAAGGRALGTATSSHASGTYTFDAPDLASGTITVGISNAYGCLIYDTQSTTVTNHGICFLAFGGAVSAPSGTLTIVFNPAGIFTVTY